jgi:hypothetical protein
MTQIHHERPAPQARIVRHRVFIASWLVFLVDLVVHERRLVRYLSTWLGRFDLRVVVLTAPWFLILGFGGRSSSFCCGWRESPAS